MVKKAQLKIQQMAFMLIALTIFFVLVGMFVLVIKISSLKEKVTTLEEQNSILLASKLANSPEFSCGEALGTQKVACIDADKAMMLKENLAKYSDFWGVSNIEIRKLSTQGEIICTTNNYPNCNIIRIIKQDVSGFGNSNFVNLCRKSSYEGKPYNHCEIAKLTIMYEKK